jgi:MFS family permease
MYGYDSAFIGTTLTLPSFERAFGLDKPGGESVDNLSSNIVSTFQGGAFFGSLFGFFLAERFGRKPTMLVAGFLFSIGVALQMVGHIGLLYGGRVLTGLGVGGSAMILPIYIAECAPAAIRGRLVGIFEVMLQIALVFGFWVNYGVNKNISPLGNTQWRIPVGVQLIPAGMLFICLSFMPESPRWLASKSKRISALRSLSWIRNLPETHEYVQRELTVMEAGSQQDFEESGEGWRHWVQLLRELNQKGVRNRMIISILMMMFQNFTGYVYPYILSF